MQNSLKYVTLDDAIKEITQLGPGTLLVKIDAKKIAFCLFPVHPDGRYMLGMQWDWAIYTDTCLPFSLHSAPKLFKPLVDLMTLMAREHGILFLIHYFGDFLTMGPPSSPPCKHNLDELVQICNYVSTPLTMKKVEAAFHFLGIILDTVAMEARLPDHKLTRLKEEVSKWIDQTDATKWGILSLVGSLQHATKVVRCSFCSRMYVTAVKLKKKAFPHQVEH